MAAGGNGESAEKRHTGKVDITPGCQVWCKTRFDEIQGTVTAYDRENGLLIIKSTGTESAKAGTFDVNIVNLNHIEKTNFKLLSMPREGSPVLLELDHGKVGKRLQDAVTEKIRKAEKIGINVSSEAQALFNSIVHFIPECKWDKDQIVVMDDVRISPPYKAENCSGQRKDSLDHLRKMVEKFHCEKQKENNP